MKSCELNVYQCGVKPSSSKFFLLRGCLDLLEEFPAPKVLADVCKVLGVQVEAHRRDTDVTLLHSFAIKLEGRFQLLVEDRNCKTDTTNIPPSSCPTQHTFP